MGKKLTVFKVKSNVSQKRMIQLQKQLSKIKDKDMLILPDDIDVQVLDIGTGETEVKFDFYDPVEYVDAIVKAEKKDILEEIGRDPLKKDRTDFGGSYVNFSGMTGSVAVMGFSGSQWMTIGS